MADPESTGRTGEPDSPIRVALVTGSFPPIACGVGDYSARLAAALGRRDDVQVDVITSEGTEPVEGVRVYPAMDHWRVSNLRKLIRAVEETQPDVLHLQLPTRGYGPGMAVYPFCAAMRWRRRIPVVVTLHEELERLMRYLPMLTAADRLLVVRDNFQRAFKFPLNIAAGDTPFELVPTSSMIPKASLDVAGHDALRERYMGADEASHNLIVYFGFLFPHRGVEQVFDIADPDRDRIVIAGGVGWGYESYADELRALCSGRWQDKATVTGYINDAAAAELLAAADAVVLPFERGGGPWNTSALAARLQGTPVVMTSRERSGYDEAAHVYYADPGDVASMREALRRYAGQRRTDGCGVASWDAVAAAHVDQYRQTLRGS